MVEIDNVIGVQKSQNLIPAGVNKFYGKIVNFSDINGGVSPQTDSYINLVTLLPFQVIPFVYYFLNIPFIDSAGNNDISVRLYDATNLLDIDSIVNPILHVSSLLFGSINQNNIQYQAQDAFANPFYGANVNRNIQLHFNGLDLTKETAGKVTFYYPIYNLQ
ncbi:MAG: hypothetical protein ABSA18_05480 [Dehalococcoidia bacterium]|jgi:hypothetical protein